MSLKHLISLKAFLVVGVLWSLLKQKPFSESGVLMPLPPHNLSLTSFSISIVLKICICLQLNLSKDSGWPKGGKVHVLGPLPNPGEYNGEGPG